VHTLHCFPHILAYVHFTLLVAHPKLDTLYIPSLTSPSPHNFHKVLFYKFLLFFIEFYVNSMSYVEKYKKFTSHTSWPIHTSFCCLLCAMLLPLHDVPISPHTFHLAQDIDLIQTFSYSIIYFPKLYSPHHALTCFYEDIVILI
jgi:hypothetical protein